MEPRHTILEVLASQWWIGALALAVSHRPIVKLVSGKGD